MSKEEIIKKLPKNLQWLLEGIKQREFLDKSWDKKLECDREGAFRDFCIRAVVAEKRGVGSGDEEGKKRDEEGKGEKQ